MVPPVLIPRHAEHLVVTALNDTRVVLLNGARQAGKSTLTRLIARSRGAQWRSFDNPQMIEAAKFDPMDFVRSDNMIVIDEVQRYPEILLPIKHQVDEVSRPGAFLLTGSARVMGLRAVQDQLPGRLETIELWPLSQGEIDRTSDDFLDRVFSEFSTIKPRSALGKVDYIDRVVRGGLPEAIGRQGQRRRAFLQNYLADLVNREVREISEIQRTQELWQLVRLLAARNANQLVPGNLASLTGLAKATVAKYLALVNEVFLIKTYPAWTRGNTGRATRTPKFAFVDSGLAANVLGASTKSLARQGPQFGSLLEGFVAMELARQATWTTTADLTLFHYRNKDQVEVDIVFESTGGQVFGAEVKASSTVNGDDFRGLRHLSKIAGNDFVGGVVFYTGSETLSFGTNLKAMPISAIWNPAGD